MRALVILLALVASVCAQIDRDVTVEAVRRAAEAGALRLTDVEKRWRDGLRPEDATEKVWGELFGYNPPGTAIQLAYLHAWLYSKQTRPADAVRAAGYLKRMADYRALVPEDMTRARVEYGTGLPAVPSFFQLADFAEAWWRVRGAEAVDAETRAAVDDALAGSADFIRVFPEWGPHNRALLRAECLAWCAKALPDHPSAGTWSDLSRVLADDSYGQWEIEDAQIYHPIWLLALFRHADVTGRGEVMRSLQVRYYLKYFQELLAPDGTIPAFGDAWWRANLARYYACLEWGAHALRDAELKWAAQRVYAAMGPVDQGSPALGHALLRVRLDGRIAHGIAPREPRGRGGRVLDDVIGKKTVFRTGWGSDDTYLLLNFRDEGDWGRRPRDYLRTMLAVEHEKMHHGTSDENAVVMFMDRGSLLLHAPGYRDVAPSGPYGAYRADIFQNRVVMRTGVPKPGTGTMDFLKNDGTYRPVRTERIDWARFRSGLRYSRTRVADARHTWDRTIVMPGDEPLFVVFDTIRIEQEGPVTIAQLWATQEVTAKGPGWVVGRYRSMRGQEVPAGRRLLMVFPDAPTTLPQDSPLRRHSQDERVVHRTGSPKEGSGRRVSFVTVLVSIGEDEDPAKAAAAVRAIPTDGADGVSITSRGETWILGAKRDLERGLLTENVRPRFDPDKARIRVGGIHSDGDFVYARADAWGATNMTHVHIDGASVFEARPFQVFQTTGRSDRVGKSRWRLWEGQRR